MSNVTAEAASAAKTCFISASLGADLSVLRRVLESRGLHVLVPRDLAVGTDWASELYKQLAQADLVIGVMTAQAQAPWVLFELGAASAMGRPILLIASQSTDPIPYTVNRFLVLRVELDNQEAIEFALDQLISAPKQSQSTRVTHARPLTSLGAKADFFKSAAVSRQSLDLRGHSSSRHHAGPDHFSSRPVSDQCRAAGQLSQSTSMN